MGKILCFLFLSALYSQVNGAWSTLGPPIEIDNGRHIGIASDNSGNIHVVYCSNSTSYYRKAGPDGAFSSREETGLPAGGSFQIVIDQNGDPHIASLNGCGSNKSGTTSYTNKCGGTWKTAINAINNGPGMHHPRVAAFGDYAAVSAFTRDDPSEGVISLIANTGSSPQKVDLFDWGMWAPSVQFTGDGKLFAAGRNGAAGHFIQEFSYSGGNLSKRGSANKLSGSTPRKTSEGHATAIDKNDVIHIVSETGWSDSKSSVFYNNTSRMNSGQGAITMPSGMDEMNRDVTENLYPEIAVDENGRPFMSFYNGNTGKLRVTTIDNNNFQQPVTAADNPSNVYRYNPQIAPAQGGGSWVAWTSGGKVWIRSVGRDNSVQTHNSVKQNNRINVSIVTNKMTLSIHIKNHANRYYDIDLLTLNGQTVLHKSVSGKPNICLSAISISRGCYLVRIREKGGDYESIYRQVITL